MHDNVPTLIIDPVMLFREGLRRILYEANFQPVWCSDCPPVGPLPALSGHASLLLIIGTEMSEAAIQIAEVKRYYPSVRVVLLLDTVTSCQLREAVRYGVDTLLLRRSSCDALIGTLKLVLEGAMVFPADLLDVFQETQALPDPFAHALLPDLTSADPPDPSVLQDVFGLSAREINVLRHLLDGLSNKEIARVLGITEATVKVHVKAVLRKARVRNRTQVAMWASRLGLAQNAAVLA